MLYKNSKKYNFTKISNYLQDDLLILKRRSKEFLVILAINFSEKPKKFEMNSTIGEDKVKVLEYMPTNQK